MRMKHFTTILLAGISIVAFHGVSWAQNALALTGEELFTISGIDEGLRPRKRLRVSAGDKSFEVLCRIDTPQEIEYYQHGGILQYVLRQMAAAS